MPLNDFQKRKALELSGYDPNSYTVDDENNIVEIVKESPPVDFGNSIPKTSVALQTTFDTPSPLESFGRSALRNAPAAAAGGVGAATGVGLATGLGMTGAASFIPPIALALIASYGMDKVMDMIEPEEEIQKDIQSLQTNPIATKLGGLSTIPLGGFNFSPSVLRTGLGAVPKLATGMARTPQEIVALKNIGIGGAIGGASTIGASGLQNELPDVEHLLEGIITGALFNKPNAIGRRMGFTDPMNIERSLPIRQDLIENSGPVNNSSIELQLTPSETASAYGVPQTRGLREVKDGGLKAVTAMPEVEVGNKYTKDKYTVSREQPDLSTFEGEGGLLTTPEPDSQIEEFRAARDESRIQREKEEKSYIEKLKAETKKTETENKARQLKIALGTKGSPEAIMTRGIGEVETMPIDYYEATETGYKPTKIPELNNPLKSVSEKESAADLEARRLEAELSGEERPRYQEESSLDQYKKEIQKINKESGATEDDYPLANESLSVRDAERIFTKETGLHLSSRDYLEANTIGKLESFINKFKKQQESTSRPSTDFETDVNKKLASELGNVKPTSAWHNLFTKFGGEQRNVKIEADGSIINTKTGAPISGVAYLRKGLKTALAKINPAKAGVDTHAHELFHVFVDDLAKHGSAGDKKLVTAYENLVSKSDEFKTVNSIRASQGREAWTPNEFITTEQGMEFLRRNLNLENESGIKTWYKDFWSHVKTKYSSDKANNADFRRLLQYRFQNDPSFGESFGGDAGKLNTTPVNPDVDKKEQEISSNELKFKKADNYDSTGNYRVDYPDGSFTHVFRDKDTMGGWRESDGKYAFGDVIGWTKKEALQTLQKKEGLKFLNRTKEQESSSFNQDDVDRFNYLTSKRKDLIAEGKGFSDEDMVIWKELEKIKNKYGGMSPEDEHKAVSVEDLKNPRPLTEEEKKILKAGITRKEQEESSTNPHPTGSKEWMKFQNEQNRKKDPLGYALSDLTFGPNKNIKEHQRLMNLQNKAMSLAEQADNANSPNFNKIEEILNERPKTVAEFEDKLHRLIKASLGETDTRNQESSSVPSPDEILRKSKGEGKTPYPFKMSELEITERVKKKTASEALDAIEKDTEFGNDILSEDTERKLNQSDNLLEINNKESNALNQESSSINLNPFKSEIERVRSLPHKQSKAVADVLTKFYEYKREYTGSLGNDIVGKLLDRVDYFNPKQLASLNNEKLQHVVDYLYDIQDTGKSNISLTAEEKLIERDVRDNLNKSLTEKNKFEGLRKTKVGNPNYLPHMLSRKVADILLNKSGTSEHAKLMSDWYDYYASVLKQPKTKADEDFKALKDAFTGKRKNSIAEQFGPIDKAAGLGLPRSWRETNLVDIMTRFNSRYARRLAYHKSIELAPEEVKNTLNDPITGIAAQDNVKNVTDDIAGIRDFNEDTRTAVLGVIRSAMLGPLTGAKDFTSNLVLGFQHQDLRQAFMSPVKAFSEMNQNISESFRAGVNRHNISSFELGEGGINDMISLTRRAGDILNIVQGRNYLERLARATAYGQGKFLVMDNIWKAKKGTLNAQNRKFLNDFVEDWKTYKNAGEVPEDVLMKSAAKFVESVQGTYDPRGLPAIAMRGSLAPYLSLTRWSIEKFNNFNKHVVNPAKQGNFTPLLMSTLGMFLGGEAINQLVQLATGRREKTPNYKEIAVSKEKEEAIAYKLAGLSSLSGFGGVMGDLFKSIMDVQFGNRPQVYNNPLISGIETGVQDIGFVIEAVKKGELESVADALSMVLEDYFQSYRLALNHLSPEKKKELEKSDKFRDLKIYKTTNNLDIGNTLSDRPNPLLNKKVKEFKQTDNISEALELLPELVQDAIKSSTDDGVLNPEKLKAKLGAIKANNYSTMPSPENMPQAFIGYLEFLRATKGEEEASARLLDYIKQREINKAKASAVPSL